MSRKIRKLLFISDAPLFGGAEQYVAGMAYAARARGIEPVVCWLKPADIGVFSEWQRLGDSLHLIPADRAGSLYATWHELSGVIRRIRPDAAIINASGRSRFWLAPCVTRRFGVPSAWVHHMVDQHDYRRLPPARLGGRVEGLHLWRVPQAARHRLAAAAANAVIVLNESDRRQIAGEHTLSPHRIIVVANGVDTQRYQYNAEAGRQMRAAWMHSRPRLGPCDAFVVGTAGRLVSSKGISLLLEAAAILRRQNTPIFVVIAGNGPDRDALATTASRLGIADAVSFVGFVSDMPAFYSGLDTFVLCSHTESFGLVLAEAHACERAVIATPTPGAAAQIAHHEDGILLKSFAAGELAEALLNLYRQPSWRNQLGRNGRARVLDHFSIQRALEQTLQLLEPSSTAYARSTMPDVGDRVAGRGCV